MLSYFLMQFHPGFRSNHRVAAGTTGILMMLLAAACGGGGPETDGLRPNVILILTDDQGYGEVGAHGNDVIQTPNLARLYEESVRLTDYHVAPVCTPTRAQLITGQDAVRTGAWGTTWGRSLPRRELTTVAEVFAANGYRTGHFGKWHLGDNYPYRPEDRGFQEVVRHGGGGVGQQPDYWGNNYFDDVYCHNGGWKKYEGYCTDVWFDEAMRFIEESYAQDDPFFCYIPTNAPHGPYFVAERYESMYAGDEVVNPAFYGMITNIDENIGRLEEKLRELDIRSNTILMFMTDNGSAAGCSLDEEGFVSAGFNAGMRGKKGSYYEGGHRVPFFIRWPAGGLGSPRDVEVLATAQDFMPTLIDLCRLEPPAGAVFDGVSLAGALTGGAEPMDDRMIVVQYSQTTTHPPKWRSAVLWGKWRLVHGEELYNIAEDPRQRQDVAAANPEVVQQMREHYEQWWAVVSPGFVEVSRIPVGHENENPTTLHAFDWHGRTAWNQRHVLAGAELNNYWTIEVSQSGTYEISLRRWPKTVSVPLTGAPADGGKKLPIRSARLAVAGFDETRSVDKQDEAATFRLELKEGNTRLQTWFLDETGTALCGAYYVEVRRL